MGSKYYCFEPLPHATYWEVHLDYVKINGITEGATVVSGSRKKFLIIHLQYIDLCVI